MSMKTWEAAAIRKGIMCARWWEFCMTAPKPKASLADGLYQEAVWRSGALTGRAFKRTLFGQWDRPLPASAKAQALRYEKAVAWQAGRTAGIRAAQGFIPIEFGQFSKDNPYAPGGPR